MLEIKKEIGRAVLGRVNPRGSQIRRVLIQSLRNANKYLVRLQLGTFHLRSFGISEPSEFGTL